MGRAETRILIADLLTQVEVERGRATGPALTRGLARVAAASLTFPATAGRRRRLVDEARRLEQLAWAALLSVHPATAPALHGRVRRLWLRATDRRRRREESEWAAARRVLAAGAVTR